ncbi:MAG: UDP-N-acetylmuramoyl-L-alanyl-D-glutamate--2,6-diaminopimelate ligase [Deltaproteobacteria bacterium]|nr:UDP-N-acetylmuramoyl-L-alanyl-D-glutamate--2,6-diaminopimelate ligase [Deltaproteobacteria bacterium]
MRLKELLGAGEVDETGGDMDQAITGLSYDSRRVKKGHIFFAVPGERLDGHEFAAQALEQGAAAVVMERRVSLPQGVTWIRVRNVRRTMGMWSALFFASPSRRMVLVGITGTNGKTTVSYLLESIFSAAGMAPGVIGTINYRYQGRMLAAPYTTPESVDLQALLAEMVEADVKSVAMEVSSHALEMERVRGIEFDAALFTNLTRDHLDFHMDMERYFSAKSRLFTDYLRASAKQNKFAVIHGGDPRGRELLDKVRELGFEVMSYGRGREWDVHPLEFEGDLDGLRGKIRVKDLVVDFSSRLIGPANLENILGAVGVGFALGLPKSAISEGIARLESVPGRLEKIRSKLGVSVLVDYAHTPDALERVLLALRELIASSGFQVPSSESMPKMAGATNLKPETPNPKLICVFGCGGDRDRGKRSLMGEIAGRLSDLVILTSDNPRTEEPLAILEEIEDGVRKTGRKKFQISDFRSQIENRSTEAHDRSPKSQIQNLKLARGYCVEPDRRTAIRLALRLARSGDLVLIAGKGHEDYQILGPKRIHFDDREVAREELDSIQSAK